MPNGSTTATRTARRLQHQAEKITKLENQIATQQATIHTLTTALQHQAAAAQLLSTLIHNTAPPVVPPQRATQLPTPLTPTSASAPVLDGVTAIDAHVAPCVPALGSAADSFAGPIDLTGCATASAAAADPAGTPRPPAPPSSPPHSHSSPPPSSPLAAPAVLRPPPVDPAVGSYTHEPYDLCFEDHRSSTFSPADSFMDNNTPPPTTTNFNAHYPAAPPTPSPPVSLSSGGNSGALCDLHRSLQDTSSGTSSDMPLLVSLPIDGQPCCLLFCGRGGPCSGGPAVHPAGPDRPLHEGYIRGCGAPV